MHPLCNGYYLTMNIISTVSKRSRCLTILNLWVKNSFNFNLPINFLLLIVFSHLDSYWHGKNYILYRYMALRCSIPRNNRVKIRPVKRYTTTS